jgi:hypothetical protein
MRANSKRGSAFFPNLFAFFVLAGSVFFQYFWFFLPAAVHILHRSRFYSVKFIPWMAFSLIAVVGVREVGATELDVLALVIFFLEGLCLSWWLRNDAKMTGFIFYPLLGGSVLALIVFGMNRLLGFSHSYHAWSLSQFQSEVFPYFFRMEEWPEALLSMYETVIRPILLSGLFAWFGCMVAMAYFINGIIENIVSGKTAVRRKSRPKLWEQFSGWRSSEWVLAGLFLGLLLLSLRRFFPQFDSPLWEIFGWHLTIFSLFPIFIQGMALTSYFIPRLSMFAFVAIFIVLLLKPIPVLILAGFSDLWFDFRSKIRSDPRV